VLNDSSGGRDRSRGGLDGYTDNEAVAVTPPRVGSRIEADGFEIAPAA
jgi:hypothetical protein